VELQILFEDNHLLAVNKPSGLLTQGDETGDYSLVDAVNDYLVKKYDKPGAAFVGLIHRIDRPVSGLVLLAKTSKALERMNKLFHDREVQKKYLAVVRDKVLMEEGDLVNFLKKSSERNLVHAHDREVRDSKRAELSYRVKKYGSKQSLLEVMPKTGRPHQIRVQLSHMGHPIVGDVKYGYHQPTDDQSIALHSWKLAFIHPVTKEPMQISCPIPRKPWWQLAWEK
jgi:23S rRNA pseudouridine1911/1915/1917 synthase